MKYFGEPEKRWHNLAHKLRRHPHLWGEDDAKADRIGRLISRVVSHAARWEAGQIGAWCVYVDGRGAGHVRARSYTRAGAERAVRDLIQRYRIPPSDQRRLFVAWRPVSEDIRPHALRGRCITPPLD